MLYSKQLTINNNDSLSKLYAFVSPQTTVLDAGCACGGLAEALVKKKNCNVYGMEYNPESVACCKKLQIFSEIHQQDLNLLTHNDFPSYFQKFDYIVCGDVLEHLLYPDMVLKILLSYLKSDGEILISLPNLAHASIKATLLQDNFTYTDLGILDKTHLHFYTYKTIAEFLTNNNLRIMDCSPVFLALDGYQKDTFSDLPQVIQAYIKADKHSHVMQYTMKCRVDKKISCQHNINQLNNWEIQDQQNQSTFLFKIKRLLITRFSGLLKWIEYFRK